jgi:hypothetical protein
MRIVEQDDLSNFQNTNNLTSTHRVCPSPLDFDPALRASSGVKWEKPS